MWLEPRNHYGREAGEAGRGQIMECLMGLLKDLALNPTSNGKLLMDHFKGRW